VKYGTIYSVFIICFVLSVFSDVSYGDDNLYGPPLEVGVSARGLRMQSRPEWSSKYIYGGGVHVSLRLYRGLAVQAGRNYGKGDEPRPDLIDYGKGIKLWTHEKTFEEVEWYSIRYEIPAHYVRIDFMSIDFISVSAGISETKFGLYSSYRFTDEKAIKLDNTEKFRVATVDGKFVELAARWRFETEDSEETGSWFGAYGLGLGVRYTRYGDVSRRHDNIREPRDAFNSLEVFLNGFIKIKLLY